jgi:glutathione S-transferase
METVLAGRRFFAADTLTVADIALLAYTRRAPLAGFDLGRRPAVGAWIGRCDEALGLEPVLMVDG